ncbi:MAG: MerC domain-containing protein [Pseudomonadota bacterium]
MPASDQTRRRRADRLAIALSALCLVHCLAIPLAVVVTPALAVALVGSETTLHVLLLAVALPVTVYALGHGYRIHGRRWCVALGGVGLALMTLGVSHLFGMAWEVPLTLAGVSLLTVAHVMNLRAARAPRAAADPARCP